MSAIIIIIIIIIIITILTATESQIIGVNVLYGACVRRMIEWMNVCHCLSDRDDGLHLRWSWSWERHGRQREYRRRLTTASTAPQVTRTCRSSAPSATVEPGSHRSREPASPTSDRWLAISARTPACSIHVQQSSDVIKTFFQTKIKTKTLISRPRL